VLIAQAVLLMPMLMMLSDAFDTSDALNFGDASDVCDAGDAGHDSNTCSCMLMRCCCYGAAVAVLLLRCS
jgi:hypothetical protein